MALSILDAGTLREITRLFIRQSGVNRRIRTLKVMDGGTLRTVAVFADPLTVTAIGALGEANSSSITTGVSTATVAGGFSPYTYAWTRLTNGGANASTAGSPTLASTTFTKTGLIPGQEAADTWRVTVTDAIGSTASADMSATFIYSTGA